MKLKIKIPGFKILSLLVMVTLLAAGCGGGGAKPQGPVTLTFWKTFEDSENMQVLIDMYQAKNKNVQIVYTKKNIENYESDLLNALAAGTGPDIFSIHNSWLPKYMDKVVPADAKAFPFKEYKDAFVDVAVQDFTRDNKIYAVPLTVDSLALYYNKDLMGTVGIATPPKTWSELSSHVQRLKKQDTTGYFSRSAVAAGTNSNINRAVDILYLYMLQRGVIPYSADGTQPTFDQGIYKNGNYVNPAEDALDYYTSFASPLKSNYNWNYRSDYSIDAFANGRVAYMYNYSYARATIIQKAPQLNFDVAPVPQPNLDDPAVNFANYWGEAVSKQSKNQAAAWDFLKFISSKEALDAYYAHTKYPSSRKDLIELQTQDPDIGVFASANLTAKAFYRPDQAKMDAIFGQTIDNIILKGFTTSQAIGQAAQQAGTLTRF